MSGKADGPLKSRPSGRWNRRSPCRV